MLHGVALALMLLALSAPLAQAHGPCDCLSPASGPSGTRVHATYPIYKVIFNPDRSDLPIGPDSLWQDHRPGAPVTVYRDEWRYSSENLNSGGSFTIPQARPGRYLIALYDGGEGGVHYSWDWFTVTPEKAEAASSSEADPTRISPWFAVLSAAAALAIGVAVGLRIRHG